MNTKTCSVWGCEKSTRSRRCAYCEMHYCRLRRTGTLRQKSKPTIDDGLFEKITEEEAWILGLLWSDGYLRGNRIMITSKDKDMLQVVNRIAKGNSICIKKRKSGNYYDWSFSNKIVADRLRRLGMFQAKSFTIKWPNINSKLNWHFIRGLIDGDGCICINKKGILTTYVCSASRGLALSLLNWYLQNGINSSMAVKTKTNPLYVVSTGQAASVALYGCLYPSEETPCLKRKKIIFKKGVRPLRRPGRKKGSPYSKIETKVIKYYLEKGKTYRSTAKKFNMCIPTVMKIIKKRNVTPYSGRGKLNRLDDGLKKSIIIDRNKGMTFECIQNKYNLNRDIIRKIVRGQAISINHQRSGIRRAS